ncbi:MAG: monomeric [FeFe] hydrogenase [Elusimicrobia bacterium]|nr:monomeric [FeFe] hydrogenase [Elusimicrobiota bacterium]MDY6039079.1 monomeric [FeFe] hydrogenase [Elusimicrobiaceae bacterium]
MNTSDNKAVYFKREALKRVVKAFDEGLLETKAYRIPFDVIPQDSKSAVRCCIYKERAVFRARTLAALGCSVEKDDEATSLNDYAKEALLRKDVPEVPLTVMDIACKGCVKARHIVTEACQGCLARPCQQACKFGAISFENGRSKIDADKCKNCGQCKEACPYNAITYVPVPCEQSCPVNAIHKGENGFAEIDFEKCISCGHCMEACPFGAIMERSQLIDILSSIKSTRKVCAMIAPSIVGQFNCTLPQLMTAVKKAGFDKVTEVAEGADITTANEARELIERLEGGARFMTTSCCAAWIQAVKKHLPALKEFVSHTKTPASYTADIEKKNGFTTVFVGPCVSKRVEGMEDPNIDYVMTYEELGAMLEAKGINPAECEETPLDPNISGEARYYGVTGGVAQAVENALNGKRPFKKLAINGLDKKAMLMLNAYAKGAGDFQLLEVMSCKGGCIGGPCTMKKQAQVIKPIKDLVANSPKVKPAFDEEEKKEEK